MVMSDKASSEVQLESDQNSSLISRPAKIVVENSSFLQQSIDKPTDLIHPVAKFLQALKEINIYIAIQSVLDAIDLWLGALKYYYDILNPIGNKASTSMMYEELRTPIGMLVFLLGGVFFASFAFLGNYYDPKRKDSKMPDFSKYADVSWPFVRDCLKGLKWTFKGTKSIIIVFNLLLQLNYTSLIAPLGIIFGILAASNRFWNRDMVEKRKLLQSVNNSFRENIKFINTCFMEIPDSKWLDEFDELSNENKSCYRGCVIKVSQNLSQMADEIELTDNGWYDKYYYVDYNSALDTYQRKLFYCHSHPSYEIAEPNLKAHSIQLSVGAFNELIERKPINRLNYANQTIISGKEVYFCDAEGQVFLMDDKQQSICWKVLPKVFYPGVSKAIGIENLNQLLQQGLTPTLEAKFGISVGDTITVEDHCYYINAKSQLERIKKVKNGYIPLEKQDYQPDTKKLTGHEILFFNQCKLNHENKLDYFNYKTLLKNEVQHQGFLQHIFQDKTRFIEQKIKNVDELKKLYEIPRLQPNSSSAYFSAFTSGLFNAPYYFLGILTMASIPANLLVFAVGVCSFFMVLNLTAELYQEFDFQRRLDITAVKAKLSMIKRCISLEWDAINEYLAESVDSPSDNEYKAFDIDIEKAKPFLGCYGELELKYELSLIKLFLSDGERLSFQHLISMINFANFNGELQQEFTELIQQASIRRHQFKSHFEHKKDIFLEEQYIQDQYENVFAENRNISPTEKKFLISFVRLELYNQEYKTLNAQLKTNLVIPPFATIMQGIKNGLHIYGMFNGLLITIYSMGAWSFNLSFFVLSITVGISMVLFATIYTTLFAKPEEKEIDSLDNSSDSFSDTPNADKLIAFHEKNNPQDLKVPYWYDKAKYDHVFRNDNAIVPSKNLLISEQCEVFRQAISGIKKGIKFLESIFLLLPSLGSEPSLLTIIFYPVVALVYGMIFALKGLRGLMRVDQSDYENSILVGRFFKKPESLTITNPDSPLGHSNITENWIKSRQVNSGSRVMARAHTPVSSIGHFMQSSENIGEVSPSPRQVIGTI
jgi:hypothetical protein